MCTIIVTVSSPNNVITGLIVSCTITVRVLDIASCPTIFRSYLSVNGPIMSVFKSAIFDVIEDVKTSPFVLIAVAPASTYVDLASTVTVLSPFIVIRYGEYPRLKNSVGDGELLNKSVPS